jgi:hypothetical protein
MMTRLFALALALLTLTVELTGSSPGGPGFTLALAALLASHRTTGTLASLLAITALGVSLGDGEPTLLSPMAWLAHVTLGVAIGSVARHADGATVRACHLHAPAVALGIIAFAAFAALLPDGLVQWMNADGTPLQLSLTLSEPEMAKQLPVLVPARLAYGAPLATITSWTTWLAALAAVLVTVAALVTETVMTRIALSSVALLALALIVPALADLTQLAGGGPVALPIASDLIVELGWTSGGVTGLALQSLPEQGHLTLASRPVTSTLRLVVGIALLGWLWTRRSERPAPELQPAAFSWCWAGAAAGLVAWFGFMAFASAERVDAVAAWGPSPVAYSALAGALIAFAAGVGGLFDERSARWATALELLALGVWCCGVVAPTAGWLPG